LTGQVWYGFRGDLRPALDGGGECKDVPAALPGDQRAERSEHSPHAGKDEDVAGGAFA
jgi:hypothetical protein